MGVKLRELLPRKEIAFDDLKGREVAVDASNMLYQFLSSIRQPDGSLLTDKHGNITSHLVGIFSRFSNLMSKGIKMCVVFDGKPPLLKIRTREEREYRKQLAEEKLERAREEENEEAILKYSKQVTRLNQKMIDESKELFSALGLPVIQAPSESDAQMAFMNEKNDVWACATTDVDPLLHGAPRLVTNLTLSQRRKLPSGKYVKINPELVVLSDVLNNLGITGDQLIVISMLIGTDYNEGVKGIGPKTALKLVKQHKNFDELFKQVDVNFNWKEVYAIFKSMPIMKNYQLKWKGVDYDKINELLVKKHDFSLERVENSLKKLEKEDKEQRSLFDL